MIGALAERLYRRFKGDGRMRLDPRLSGRDILEVTSHRIVSALRGLLMAPRMGCCRLPLLLGGGTILRHRRHVFLGRGCIIEDGVRLDALSLEGFRCGDNLTIARNSTVSCTGVVRSLGVGIRIGSNCAIGAHSFLGGQGGITIGDDVIMGPGVSIFSENHRFADGNLPIRLQGEQRAAVEIGNDCWIGAGSIILAGVRIGSGSVIGAGSLVTRSIPPGVLAMGRPAHVVRRRAEGDIPDET